MRQDDRGRWDEALARARRDAYGDGEFVGQEGFMRATEIMELAGRAGVAPGVGVLDLCCGVAGPGRLLTRELECRYLGVDASAAAVGLARARGAGLQCRFEVAQVPPVPSGPFEVVLLLETMLAFPEKAALLDAVAEVLPEGGRFAFTVEAGGPLTREERERMPEADTVWPVPMHELVAALHDAGLRVAWQRECTRVHRSVVVALLDAYAADAAAITAQLGALALEEIVAAHRLWNVWLGSGRVRKFAVVAEKVRCRAGTADSTGSSAAR